MKKLVLVLMIVVLSSAFLSAELYVKNETKTGAFMGQPAKTTYTEQWYGKDKTVTVTPESKTIVDLVAKKTITIIHQNKTYMEMGAGDVEGMMGAMNMTFSMVPNGQTKKVGNYNCKGYDFNMNAMGMKMKMVMWATTNLPFDWKAFSKYFYEAMKTQMRGTEKMLQELKKMEGYPIVTETEMMGMKIVSTVVDINPNKAAPADLYSIPAGYKKASMADMMKGKK